MSEVLYRKWRPQSFAEVVGQDAITRTLRNSIASGGLAHAYLFCGPRGTGKTTLGRLLAKAANCAAPLEGEPCNRCDSCAAVAQGRSLDFIEQDAASHNSVDDVRQLRENVILTPMSGARKVYLLDEVHMMSTAAQNALLKTLEEPPPHIVFVLATTDPHKVSATIISRCQRFDLKRIALPGVVERLAEICKEEGFSLATESLEEIARSATGSLRDAINGLEQVVTYYGGSAGLEQVQEALGVTVDARSGELARLALAGDLASGLRLIAAVRDDGVDIKQFAKQVARYLRGLLLVKAGASDALELPRDAAEDVKTAAQSLNADEIVRALRTFGQADFRDDPLSSLPLELAFVGFVAEVKGRADAPTAKQATATKASAPAAAEPQPSATAVAGRSDEDKVPEQVPDADPVAPRNGQGDLLTRVRDACKETDKQLAGLLNGSCEVKGIEGDVVTMGFYHTFHLERIETGPLAQRLEELLSQALGKPVSVVYEHTPRARDEQPARSGHLVKAARELGARPIDDDER